MNETWKCRRHFYYAKTRYYYSRRRFRCRRQLMYRVSLMAAAFVRLVTTFGLLLVIIAAAWTSLFFSARYSYALRDTDVYAATDDAVNNSSTRYRHKVLEAGLDGQFHLNGKPKRILSGEFHYFRVHPGQWDDRLRRMRTAGLNTITTRIPWNIHEPQQSAFTVREFAFYEFF